MKINLHLAALSILPFVAHIHTCCVHPEKVSIEDKIIENRDDIRKWTTCSVIFRRWEVETGNPTNIVKDMVLCYEPTNLVWVFSSSTPSGDPDSFDIPESWMTYNVDDTSFSDVVDRDVVELFINSGVTFQELDGTNFINILKFRQDAPNCSVLFLASRSTHNKPWIFRQWVFDSDIRSHENLKVAFWNDDFTITASSDQYQEVIDKNCGETKSDRQN